MPRRRPEINQSGVVYFSFPVPENWYSKPLNPAETELQATWSKELHPRYVYTQKARTITIKHCGATYTTVHIHFIATCYWLWSFCRGNRVSLLRFSIRQVYGRMNKWNVNPRSLPCCCALALNQWLMQETLCCAWLVRNWNLDLFCAWNSRLVLVASGPWHAVLLPLKWLLGKWQGHPC